MYLVSTFCPSGTLQVIFCLIFNIRPKPGLSVSGAFTIIVLPGDFPSRAPSRPLPGVAGEAPDRPFSYAPAVFLDSRGASERMRFYLLLMVVALALIFPPGTPKVVGRPRPDGSVHPWFGAVGPVAKLPALRPM